jgi:hypothetical protein
MASLLNQVPRTQVDSGEAAGKPDCPTSGVILTRGKGKLQDLFSIYPKAASSFRGSIRAANLDKGIKGTDFQSKKERILILYYLFENYKGLNAKQTRSLGDAVLLNRDKQKTLGLLKSFSKADNKGGWFSVIWGARRPLLSKEEAMWRNAHNYASSISDVRFLSYLKTVPATHFLRTTPPSSARGPRIIASQRSSIPWCLGSASRSYRSRKTDVTRKYNAKSRAKKRRNSRSPGSSLSGK